MKLGGLWKYLNDPFGQPKQKTDWIVIQEPSALASEAEMPWELKYVLSLRPSRQDMISGLLEDGYGLGLSYHKQAPPHVTRAVKRVADLTQEGLAHHWLGPLLKYGREPVWEQAEEEEAVAQGINLKQEIQTIKDFGEGHGRLALVKFPGMKADESSLDGLKELNLEMRPMAAPWLINLLLEQIEPLKFPVGLLIGLAMLVIGPLAHLFQIILPNLGLSLAVIFPAVLFSGQTAYKVYMSNQGAWRVKRKYIWEITAMAMVLLLAAAAWPLYGSGQLILAGMFFSLGIILVPVTQILRRVIQMVKSMDKLVSAGKLSLNQSYRWTTLGEEARGLVVRLAGLMISWFLLVWIFFIGSSELNNGWFVAGLACLPLILAEAIAWLELKLERWLHTRSIKRLWRQTVILTTDAWQ
ncbi:MAG: hypothetical protein WC750_00455 [Patescibacteria group bacterium]|jgi:hypothetical protein